MVQLGAYYEYTGELKAIHEQTIKSVEEFKKRREQKRMEQSPK